MRKDPWKLQILLALAVLIFPAAVLGVDSAPEAAEISAFESVPTVCSESSAIGLPKAIAMGKCDDCTGVTFSPEKGVVCTYANDCQPGQNFCCEYTCACGDSTGLPGPPANACSFTAPTNCCNCPVTTFSPKFGIVCDFQGSCQADNCCEYNCVCGRSTGLPGTPANTCALDLPTNCCLEGTNVCERSYCNGFGTSCQAVGCGVGCCIYECGFSDSSCTGFEDPPAGAC